MDAHSFTIGADYRIYVATVIGPSRGATHPLRDVSASDRMTMLEANDGCGEIGSASHSAALISGFRQKKRRKALPHRNEFCLKRSREPLLPPGLVLGTSLLFATALTLRAQSANFGPATKSRAFLEVVYAT